MTTEVPQPSDSMFGPVPLPSWVEELRPFQWEAVERINEAFDAGIRLVLLDAGTGTGKSLVGELVRRTRQANSIYACTTKALQDQYARDFPYAQVVKGRSNYLTESGKLDENGKRASRDQRWSEITCADCTWSLEDGCRWCFNRNLCPYVIAKTKAEMSELAVVNTSLFLTDSNKGRGSFTGRDLVVLDEADELENELLNHVEIVVSQRAMDRMRMLPPARKTVEDAWVSWVRDEAIPRVRDYLDGLTPLHRAKGKEIREYKSTATLLDNLRMLEGELGVGNWIYDGYDTGQVIFRPIRVGKYGKSLLWPHGKRFLLMTATAISPELMLEEIGWDEEFEVVSVPNLFPVKSRPVHITPVSDMSFKEKIRTDGESWDEMVEGVRAVLNRHPNERILVHTVSYDLARHIKDGLKRNPSPPTDQSNRPIITYTASREKADALQNYKSHSNSVLIASSMDRGVDLPGDWCRVQVVAKISFLPIKDRRVSARMYSKGGMAWYRMHAIRALIQACGRAMRSKDDWCITYVLDSQFKSNLWKSDHLFPRWYTDAVDFSVSKRTLGLV